MVYSCECVINHMKQPSDYNFWHVAPSSLLPAFHNQTAMSCGCLHILGITCGHMSFNKDTETFKPHTLQLSCPLFPPSSFHWKRPSSHSLPPPSTVLSPEDIWISSANHYMVTASAFMILAREVASSSHKTTDIQGVVLQHVMNG